MGPFLSFSFHISEGIFLLPIHNTKIFITQTNPQTVISIGYIWKPLYNTPFVTFACVCAFANGCVDWLLEKNV